jgi:hypothetical protein
MSEKEMTQTNEPKNEIDDPLTPDKSNEDAQAAHSQRRRALIAGLAAAPVVLTLMNRSAWGANCSNATVASFQQGGNALTASFTRRHPNATINGAGQLKC